MISCPPARRQRATLPVAVAVLAKAPVAGRVKTRLSPPYSMVEAARLAAAALEDTLAAVTACAVTDRLLIMEGDSTQWARPGLQVLAQRGNGLAERIDNALADAARASGKPVLIIGMDTPQVRPADLEWAASTLLNTEAVLGPALDGGFWALGVRTPRPAICAGVAMSTADTGACQLERMRMLGLDPAVLRGLADVDDAASAQHVAAAAPHTQFARLLAQLSAAA